MVLVAAAICTRSGAIVASRQYLPISRSRIESLLSTFPRLIQPSQQHTFLDTDEVRFVYQPLELHYLVLITSKASNILQDMDTLRLLGRIVGQHVGPGDEADMMAEVSLDIMLAFDEVAVCGWRESVNYSQLQTILAMESQEEIIQDIIAKNKMQEAKEAAKRKIKQIEMEKREASRRNSIGGSNGSSGGIYSSINQSNRFNEPVSFMPNVNMGASSSHNNTANPTVQTTVKSGKGMKLGSSSSGARGRPLI